MNGFRNDLEHMEATADFRGGHENLGRRVREQERELEELRSTLAETAARADMALSLGAILHGIGNAMTPVKIYLEELNLNKLGQMAFYLEKSFLELADHRKDLQRFITEDERGKAVLAYLAKLIPSMRWGLEEKMAMLEKAASAVDHATELFDVQRRMGSNGRGVLDVNELVRDALIVQKESLRKRATGVSQDLEAQLPGVLADRAGLTQVLISLMNVASEHLAEVRGRETRELAIVVRTFLADGEVKLEISQRIHEPGSDQARAATSDDGPVTGPATSLLHWCRQIVESNGGTLNLTVKGDGEGLPILIALPPIRGHASFSS
jgi:hypothetical protein